MQDCPGPVPQPAPDPHGARAQLGTSGPSWQEAVPAALLWRGTVELPAPEQHVEGMACGDNAQANLGLF